MRFGLLAISLVSAAQLLSAEPGVPSTSELRKYLCDRSVVSWGLRDAIFYHERQLRPKLYALLHDNQCAARAREELALIGDPRDLKRLIRPRPQTGKDSPPYRWAYSVASALLEPSSEEEWGFLRAAALNDFNDRWVDAGAIQTLQLIATPRSVAGLEEVQRRNAGRTKSCSRAIEYVLANPPPLIDSSLEGLAERVAGAIPIGEWQQNRNTRFNAEGDKALVDIVYATSEDVFIYTATFHRIGSLWRLRGVRETLQQFMIRSAVPATLPKSPAPGPPRLQDIVISPPLASSVLDDLLRPIPAPQPPSDSPEPRKK